MDLNIDFFKIETNNIPPEKGKVLISEPFNDDMYFRKSVIFLTECSPQGALGFTLNKIIDIGFNELVNGLINFDTSISLGGPVDNDRLFYIHSLNEKFLPHSVKIIDNIYWGGDFRVLRKIINDGLILPSQIRFFLGYAGWTKGQLDEELKKNFWLVSSIKNTEIFDFKGDLWKKKVSELDEKYQIWNNFPDSPILN